VPRVPGKGLNELEYYASPGPMTELGPHAQTLARSDVAEAIEVVQGLLVHHAWAASYEIATAGREDEVQNRSACQMLEAALQIDDRPLTEPREAASRLQVNCRHFSTLTSALLRAAGVSARARCGFGRYFEKGKWIDHWVTEIWDGAAWRLVDAQIDERQRNALYLDFDPLDVPRDRFLVAGEAWRRCREGDDDANNYGIFDMWGDWFIAGNVFRDLASLNKVELLPWDGWGVMLSDYSQSEKDAAADRAAEACREVRFEALRSLYETDDALRVPEEITSFYPEAVRVKVL
jgi:hypothetical protein